MSWSARVVIIGAGVVGASAAYHLAELGWTDVVVVDKGPIPETGGSSSHAPGLVFQTNPSKMMTELARYTVELYSALDVDGEPCFLEVGGIEVATTPARWRELQRKHGFATAWGLDATLLTPDEVAAHVPLVDPARILGGYHVASDGLAKAVRGVDAMLRHAQRKGVELRGETEVTGFELRDGRVHAVRTTTGDITTPIVLCCAGIWGPKVGRMAGVSIPVQPLGHQYAWTTQVEQLGAQEEATHPILRHQDASMYMRQHYDTYGVGSYQHRPMPLRAEDIPPPEDATGDGRYAGMPSVMAFTPDDFAKPWQDACELLPALADTKVDTAMNGLFLFTHDGAPVLGEAREVPGFWVAEAVWVTHSGGVGRAMAEWLVEGRSQIDLRGADRHRYEHFQHAPAYVEARGAQNFIEVYDIIHPLQPMEPRPLRVSPFSCASGNRTRSSSRPAGGSARTGSRPTPPCWTAAGANRRTAATRSPAATRGPRGTGRRSSPPSTSRPATGSRCMT